MKRLYPVVLATVAFALLAILSCESLDTESLRDNPTDPGSPNYEGPADTTENEAPEVPSNPNPADGASGISTAVMLTWNCSDPDNDTLAYDVYFGTVTSPPLVSSDRPEASFTPSNLETETTYYWRIIAKDGHENSTTGQEWSFTTATAGEQPPATPSNPNPSNNAINVPVTPTLSWICSHPEELDLTYDVYFGTTTEPPSVSGDQTQMTYSPDTLDFNTTYYWKIIAKDTNSHMTSGQVWSFTTAESGGGNQPPLTPSNPIPADGATGISTFTTLNWECSDPDHDPLVYDVYFGDTSPPALVSSDQTETTYNPSTSLDYSTTYYWQIIAKENQPLTMKFPGSSERNGVLPLSKQKAHNVNRSTITIIKREKSGSIRHTYSGELDDETPGSIWSFTTVAAGENQPPNSPSNPNPSNNAMNVATNNITFTWTCSDPDDDPLTYDFYLGTDDEGAALIASGLTTALYSYNAEPLERNTAYEWKVVAKDDEEHETTSATWIFTTIEGNQPPDTPSNPNPADEAIGVSINSPTLSWTCSDPDEDPLTYDVYFGDTSPPSLASSDQTATEYSLGELDSSITYYWKIVAKESEGSVLQRVISPVPSEIPVEQRRKISGEDRNAQSITGKNITKVSRKGGKSFRNEIKPITTGDMNSIESETQGPEWSFTTVTTDYPPNSPSNPNPADEATDVLINATLSWTCSDPNEDPLTYDVYFGTQANPPLANSDQANTEYDPADMEYETTHYWKIIAKDDHDNETEGPVWSFATGVNQAPDTPSNPDPEDEETDVALVDVTLSWDCSDPDDDPLTYDVYFGTEDDPPLVTEDTVLTNTEFDPGNLTGNTTYYWKILATDEHDNGMCQRELDTICLEIGFDHLFFWRVNPDILG